MSSDYIEEETGKIERFLQDKHRAVQQMEAQMQAKMQQANTHLVSTNPYMNAMPNTLTQGIGGLMQSPAQIKLREGVLLDADGKELSPEWRGAEIDRFERDMQSSQQWRVVFYSKWSTSKVRVYLSAETYSGKEVNEMARTFMEALNQRRLG